MMNKYRSYLQTTLIGLVFCGILGYSNDISANEKFVDVLTNNNETTNQIKKKVKDANPQAKFLEVPEIHLLRVMDMNSDTQQVINQTKGVQCKGKLLAQSVDHPNMVMGEHVKLLNNSKSTVSNSDTDLFNKLAWYTNRLTSNKKSFRFSTGKNIKIGLIDSGVDTKHPIINNSLNLDTARSFVEDDQSLEDTNGHGTMVAGIISQVSPDAKITPYRVISATDGESVWTIQALVQAANDNQDIVNMSLGTYKYDNNDNDKVTIEAYKRAIKYAISKNTLIVASAGNQQINSDTSYADSKSLHLPGDISGVTTVSATTKKDILAGYSNTGSNVQYTAPGGEVVLDANGYLDARELIYTTYPLSMDNYLESSGIPKGYTITYGTSFSAACVTAVFADYYAFYHKKNGANPTADEAKSNIANTSDDLGVAGKDSQYGYGLPNLIKSYVSDN